MSYRHALIEVEEEKHSSGSVSDDDKEDATLYQLLCYPTLRMYSKGKEKKDVSATNGCAGLTMTCLQRILHTHILLRKGYQ